MPRGLLLVVIAVGLSFSALGCNVHIRAIPTIPEDQRITRPHLTDFLEAHPDPKIVLRVPAPQGQLTQEQAQAADERAKAYNIFERELLKAGFTVRDRGLLIEILRDNPDLDYKSIRDKIATDIILEMVALETVDMSSKLYEMVQDGRRGHFTSEFSMIGWRMEARLILVESGEIGGIYSYFAEPTNTYFIVDKFNGIVHNGTPDGAIDRDHKGYGLDVDWAAEVLARKMITDLRGGT